jgi:6-pyruvoyltetrahydropterin/6-carboxytetrahydropterin synthase
MFHISVAREFCAAHALLIRGEREPTHGHNFHLTVTLHGPSLDADGLLLDFHALEKLLDEILRPFINANLNDTPPFTTLNPSAELIAKHIADRISASLPAITPPGAPEPTLTSIRLTEAPNCAVTYFPPP